jgi:tryptophan synthase alpha chain
MSRIQTTFATLKQQGKTALVPYITAGDPHPNHTVNLMHTLVKFGADMIELGVPFSDPMADGPVIQRASERALKHKVGLTAVLQMVKDFRAVDQKTPIILMGYANPIEAIGAKAFADKAKAADVDGVITVDYPPEECADYVQELRSRDIDPIY